ncbi:40S ribosomal protein S5-1 [Hordeum vulgare]|nr:40S ribosomal protein S5-1 [Hordeum vulgare]
MHFLFDLFLPGELSANLGAMASPKSPKDKFFVNVINPYLTEVKRHPQTLWMEDGVLHKEDLKGPFKEGSTEARMEEVEQEVFKYKLMVERGVEANFDIIAELKKQHEKEMKEV